MFSVKISKIVGGLTLLVCVISGCGKAGKPDISSDCNVEGNGDYHCTYNNKGTGDGGLCEYIVIRSYPPTDLKDDGDYSIAFSFAEETGKFGVLEGKAREDFMNKISTILSSIPAEYTYDNIGYSSKEVCSGIVKAGDVREMNGAVNFDGKSPSDFCRRWPQNCRVSTIPSSALEAYKNALISPSLARAIRIDKIKAAILALPTK